MYVCLTQITATTHLHTHTLSLFSEQEQFSEVLDAMFELLVQPGEHVIDQGDDGDNFYVIERCVCIACIFELNTLSLHSWSPLVNECLS